MKIWQKLFNSVLSNTNKLFLGIFLLAVLTYTIGIIKVGSILWGDTRYYYAYTHSIVVDGNLDFDNEAYIADFGFPNPPEISESTGKITNKFSIGAPILWIPALMVGYALTGDGYSWFTQYLVALSTIGFSIVSLYFIFRSLAKFFSSRIAIISTLTLLFTTGIFFYTFIDPLNSHSASLMLSAILLWFVVSLSSKKPSISQLITLGAVCGLSFLVRNQDVLIVLPALLYMFTNAKSRISGLMWVGFGIIGLIIAYLVQQGVVHHLFGEYGSPYLIRGESFNWLQPNFWRVLFSQGNGLIYFSPVVLICLWGVWKLIKEKNTIGAVAALIFSLQLYLIASWGPEIVGGPYGSRMFLSSLPWLGLGIGQVISQIKKESVAVGASLTFLFLLNNLLQTGIMLVAF